MKSNLASFATLVWYVLSCTNGAFADESSDRVGIAYFESHVRPILVARCYSCHSESADELKGGLRLDTREGARAGGDSGAAVVPGAPSKSHLIAAIKYDGLEMPPDAKLSDAEIESIEKWIKMGAPDPRDGPA